MDEPLYSKVDENEELSARLIALDFVNRAAIALQLAKQPVTKRALIDLARIGVEEGSLHWNAISAAADELLILVAHSTDVPKH